MTEWVRDTAWRQGCVLPKAAVTALQLTHPTRPDETVAVVATHDCDIAQDPVAETYIEVIIGCTVGKPDGNCSHGKNARKLHLDFTGADAGTVELEATAKVRIEKNALIPAFEPDSGWQLNPENRDILQFWLASRYRRSAFPDEFEKRLKDSNLASKITKILKPVGNSIIAIFFDVDNGEEIHRNGADDVYQLQIFLLHPLDAINQPNEANEQQHLQIAQETASEIARAFEGRCKTGDEWHSIELVACHVLSEEELSYAQSRRLKPWRVEYISLGSEPQQIMLNR